MIRAMVNLMITSMLFFPSRDFFSQPANFGLVSEEVWCQTSDNVSIHGWYFKASGSLNQCLLYFHGNAGNVSDRLPKIIGWLKRGVSVFLVDYRGYGKSQGSIKTGEDIYRDSDAAFSWLQKKYSSSQIILYGESLGSVPAVALATKETFLALVLEAPFTSLKELAKVHYGFAPDFLLRDFNFENESRIPYSKCPVFVLHGSEDEVVPFVMGQRLFEKAPQPKGFFRVSEGHHNDLLSAAGDDFTEKPFQFISHLNLK